MIACSRLAAALLAAAVLALGALGCGDDDSTEITVPTIEAPTEATEGDTATEPEGGVTAPGDPGGGSGGVDPSQEDSATNDKPPKPGSPEEAFEKACEQNPAACG